MPHGRVEGFETKQFLEERVACVSEEVTVKTGS